MSEAFEFWATEYAQAKEAGVLQTIGSPLLAAGLMAGGGAAGGALVGGGAGSALQAGRLGVHSLMSQPPTDKQYAQMGHYIGDTTVGGSVLGGLAGLGLTASSLLRRKQ
jgi:hypothetical protein